MDNDNNDTRAVVSLTEHTLQVHGFNAKDILESIDFPNDRFDELIRRSKKARMNAIRRLPIIGTGTSIASLSAEEAANSKPATTATIPYFKTSYPSSRAQTSGGPPVPDDIDMQEEVRKSQLARQAAIIMVQAFIKGNITRRKYFAVKNFTLTVETHDSYTRYPLPTPSFNAQDKLIRRYHRYCDIYERGAGVPHHRQLPPTYAFFCATYIQAHYKMLRINRIYVKQKEENNLRALEIKRVAGDADIKVLMEDSARKIQDTWKGYYNKRIFKFYCDLIRFRQNGDPKSILKFINPIETFYMDIASGIHVRFRLGGEAFPPVIYYKVFVHKPICDVNSFAPRDYTSVNAKQRDPAFRFNKNYRDHDDDGNNNNDAVFEYHDGWYQRWDNNGWRPISEKLVAANLEKCNTTNQDGNDNSDDDQVSLDQDARNYFCKNRDAIPSKPRPYHYNKLVRHEELIRKRKLKKMEWFKRLYHLHSTSQTNQHPKENKKKSVAFQVDVDNKHDDLFGNDSSPSDAVATTGEFDELVQWTNSLDFDVYINEWTTLATTGFSDDLESHEFALPDMVDPPLVYDEQSFELLPQLPSTTMIKKRILNPP